MLASCGARLPLNRPVPRMTPQPAMPEPAEGHFCPQMRNSAQKNSDVRRNSGRAGRWLFQNGIILFFEGEESECFSPRNPLSVPAQLRGLLVSAALIAAAVALYVTGSYFHLASITVTVS